MFSKLWCLALCAALASSSPMLRAAPADAQTCAGDCNGDGAVEIDELVTAVRIAVGATPAAACRAIDENGTGTASVNELVAAVLRALHGCGGTALPTGTKTPAPTHTAAAATSTPTRTDIPVPTTGDDAALAASERVATEPILRLLDFQARLGTPGGVSGRASVSGCQQFDCIAAGQVTGSEEDCCSDRQFTQTFTNCIFDDDLGGIVSMNGAFVLDSDTADVCTGAIPVGTDFAVSLSGLTRDVSSPDGSFSRTFQELSETFAVTPGGCTVSQQEPFGFGIRGDGRRFIDGELRRFQSDGLGNVLLDVETKVERLAIAVDSTQGSDCAAEASLTGSATVADFHAGTQFTTGFAGFHVVEHPEPGALLLQLGGAIETDCLGDMTLSTIDPVRIASGDSCFTAGRLETDFGDETASVRYSDTTGVDVDSGADGSVEQHFASCSDVPVTDKCAASAVGLCAACSAVDDCEKGLSCFSCSRDCAGNDRRCSFGDTFATCEDGIF